MIHLEWWHNDRGRLRWSPFAWIVPWAVGASLLPTAPVAVFLLLALGYSLKKRYRWLAAAAPLANGGLKAALVAVVPTVGWEALVLVFGVMAFRNLMGDLRDAAKDAEEGVATLPVVGGYRRATPFVYPLTLVTSTLVWATAANLAIWVVALAWIVEIGTYPLTPR